MEHINLFTIRRYEHLLSEIDITKVMTDDEIEPIGYGLEVISADAPIMSKGYEGRKQNIVLGGYYHVDGANDIHQLIEYVGESNIVFVKNIKTKEVSITGIPALKESPHSPTPIPAINRHWLMAQIKFEAIKALFIDDRYENQIELLSKKNRINRETLVFWAYQYCLSQDIKSLIGDRHFSTNDVEDIYKQSEFFKFLSDARGYFDILAHGDGFFNNVPISFFTNEQRLWQILTRFLYLNRQKSQANTTPHLLVQTTGVGNKLSMLNIIYEFVRIFGSAYRTLMLRVIQPIVVIDSMEFDKSFDVEFFYKSLSVSLNPGKKQSFGSNQISDVSILRQHALQRLINAETKIIILECNVSSTTKSNQIKDFLDEVAILANQTQVRFFIHGSKAAISILSEFGEDMVINFMNFKYLEQDYD